MQKHIVLFTVYLVSFLLLTACSRPAESSASNDAEIGSVVIETSSISQEDYDAVLTELDSVKAENEMLRAEIDEYKVYSDIIDAIKREDYSGAIDAVWRRVPSLANNEDNAVPEVTEADFIGTWVSSKDQNCSFILCEDQVAQIGDNKCTWSLQSNGYGPYGIQIKMSDGVGWYSWIFKDGDPNVLFGNGHATNIPNFLNPNSFNGADFFKR